MLLTISSRKITIQAGSKTEVYVSGATLECKEYIIIGQLIDGHEILVTFDGELDAVGTSVNRIDSIKIINKATGETVTRQYAIKIEDGILEFLPPSV